MKLTEPTTMADARHLDRRWVLLDARDQALGRLATRVAVLLRGKHKPLFTPHLDAGDFVVVVNAKSVKLTGQKLTQKVYRRYSGYPSGLKQQTAAELLATHPERLIEKAVKGMLPDGPLGRRLLGKLKVYPEAAHPHQAQHPQPLKDHGHAKRHASTS